jgi:hypothetical protein
MPDLWLTLVITCVIFGYAGNFYAKKTGRSPFWWILGGVVLNILILGVMLVVGGRSPKAKQFVR